jgi:predicted porin
MKLRWPLLVVGLSLSSAVFAQSSVQLFGILDSGITYVSNQNGKSNVFYQSGTMVPTIVGLRGTEDLGGGLRAIFKLVDNFNDGTGAMVNGLLFGKEAWVGLQDQKYGTLTLGNQFDYMFRYMTIDRWGYMLKYNPVYYTQQGPFSKLGLPGGAFDFDRTAGSITTNNSVSYESPIFHGFGFGGRVNIYNAAIDAMFTNTENTYNGGRVNVYEIGGYYSLTGVDEVTLEYQYDQGNAVLSDNKAQQVNLTYAHDLSKRTLVYVTLAHQWAGGDGQALATIIGSTASSSNGNQTLARVGLTVRF